MNVSRSTRKLIELLLVAMLATAPVLGQTATHTTDADYTARIGSNTLVVASAFSIPASGIIGLTCVPDLPAGWTVVTNTVGLQRVRGIGPGLGAGPQLDVFTLNDIIFTSDLTYGNFAGANGEIIDFGSSQFLHPEGRLEALGDRSSSGEEIPGHSL